MNSIEEQLGSEGFYVSTTVGWSMYPMLRNRKDRVVIRPIGNERLRKYDLPLYRRPDGKYILHRIIGVREGGYIIRGDNTYQKEQVPDAWVIGYVSEFYRNGKHKSAQGRGYRLYARLWQTAYPIRYVAVKCIHLAKRVGRKLFRRNRQTTTQNKT